MKMTKTTLAAFTAIITTLTVSGANVPHPTPAFQHLGLAEGLTQLSVISVMEDGSGCIWIGTNDGLNRIKGDVLSSYRHIYDDSGSLPDDEIKSLSPTCDGSVIVCTKLGISVYDRDRDAFQTLRMSSGPSCAFDLRRCPSLLKTPSRWLLFSERGTLMAADPYSGECDTLALHLHVSCYLPGRDSSLYIGSSGSRVFRLSSHSKSPECILDLKLPSTVDDILEDAGGQFWLALTKDGLVVWNPGEGSVRRLTINDGLSSNLVREIKMDDNGLLWIATGNNITLLNPADFSISYCEHDFNKPEALSSASVKTLCKDHTGAMWVGSFYGGVNYYNPQSIHFHSFILPEHLQGGQEAVIRAMSTDPDGSVWIGTSRSGIIRHDPGSGIFERFRRIPAADNALNAVAYHKGGREVLFGCSMSGLSIYDKYKDRIIWNYGQDMVFSITPYDQERYIIGGLKGLKLFDFRSMQLKDIFVAGMGKQRVFHTFRDGSGHLWIGLADRLIKGALTEEDGQGGYSIDILESYYDIRQVQDILQDNDKLWFAAKTGLFRYDCKTKEWRSCSSAQGLSTNLIRGLETDPYGYLWAATDRSLLWIDPETFSFQEWGMKDGLINTKYNSYAHCKTADGRLWFGGTPGISWFFPNNHAVDSQPDKPFLVNLYVNGMRHDAPASDKSGKIHLRAGERNLLLELARPQFFSKDAIEYKMEGVDKDWRKMAPSDKSVAYPYLPSGNNVFLFRTVRPFGHQASEPARLTIQVEKYWYQTNGFWLTILLSVFFLVYGIFLYMAQHSRSEIESIRGKAERDIEAKRISSYMTLASLNRPRDIAFMKQALAVMEQNLSNESFDVDAFAAQMGMSRSNLHLRMKSVFGASTTAFVRRLRIEKAMEYMQEGKMNISEISYAVGFSSATYFATAFKQLTGTTPTEWKQQLFNH